MHLLDVDNDSGEVPLMSSMTYKEKREEEEEECFLPECECCH